MRTYQSIGTLLIAGAIGVLIPYTILTFTFEYPNVLRKDPGQVLTQFQDGGSSLIFTWWAFAMLGLPLLVAYIQLGKRWKNISFMNWATTLGVISGIAQIIGLLRWVFVVPVLAHAYVSGDEATQKTTALAFQIVHQFGGVLLGEHIGQLFTIGWTILINYALLQLNLMPKWISYFGFGTSIIYLLAQAELFGTVIPAFPVWDMAGFIGSTLWLVWLIVIGVGFLKLKSTPTV